jgi:hypothetical protein
VRQGFDWQWRAGSRRNWNFFFGTAKSDYILYLHLTCSFFSDYFVSGYLVMAAVVVISYFSTFISCFLVFLWVT